MGKKNGFHESFTYQDEIQKQFDKYIYVDLNNNQWKIPVWIVVIHRAYTKYMDQKFDSIFDSVFKDTIPHFKEDEMNILEWADEMDCDTLESHAELMNVNVPSFNYAWENGSTEVK